MRFGLLGGVVVVLATIFSQGGESEVATTSKYIPEQALARSLEGVFPHPKPAEAPILPPEAPAVQPASPEPPTAIPEIPEASGAMAPVASSARQDPVYPAEMVDAICNQGFAWNCQTALRICWLEMGQKYQPWAVNPHSIGGNHATGLCQIMLPYPHAGLFPAGTDPLNPYHNAAAAYQLWAASGGTFCRHWSYWC